MTLHWGAEYIRNCLPDDLAARFHECYADPSLRPDAVGSLPIYNGKTGELVMEMAAENPCRVSRSKMRNLFSEGLEVQYGKEASAAYVVDDSTSPSAGRVRVDFVDGSHAIGDVVVGADGAKSQLREFILGAEAAQLTSAPVNLFNFSHKFPADLALRIRAHNDLFMTSIHPDHGTMFWLSSTPSPSPKPPLKPPPNTPSSNGRPGPLRPRNLDFPVNPKLAGRLAARERRPLEARRPHEVLQVPRNRVRGALAVRGRRRLRRRVHPPRPRHVLGQVAEVGQPQRQNDAMRRCRASHDSSCVLPLPPANPPDPF